MVTRTGDYVWNVVYLDGSSMVQIAYLPLAATVPELRDVVPDTADVPAAIVRLVQGYRPRVVGVWVD